MLEMLRKKLIDAGIDPAVGSMDYWGTELEGVLLDMYDQGAASEREACARLCESMGVYPELNVWNGGPDWYKRQKECAAAIRARGEK